MDLMFKNGSITVNQTTKYKDKCTLIISYIRLFCVSQENIIKLSQFNNALTVKISQNFEKVINFQRMAK